MILGSTSVKAVCRMLMKLSPARNIVAIQYVTLFWPILDPQQPYSSFGYTCSNPPSYHSFLKTFIAKCSSKIDEKMTSNILEYIAVLNSLEKNSIYLELRALNVEKYCYSKNSMFRSFISLKKLPFFSFNTRLSSLLSTDHISCALCSKCNHWLLLLSVEYANYQIIDHVLNNNIKPLESCCGFKNRKMANVIDKQSIKRFCKNTINTFFHLMIKF